MKLLSIRGTLGFGVPVLLIFGLCAAFAITGHPQSYYFLLAGPLSGIIGGMAYGRRWGLPIVLGLCFAFVGVMFALQDVRSPLFSNVIWTGFVSAFLFWLAGGCAMLTLPAEKRFNGAAALAVPGAIAGMVFQFLYGPAHFLFDLGSRKWWGDAPWEHLTLWLIAGAGGGWLLGSQMQRLQMSGEKLSWFEKRNAWALASIICGLLGLGIGAAYFLRSTLPLGLVNSLSPASAASDWFWGWGLLASAVAIVAVTKRHGRRWAAVGIAFAVTLVVASYRLEASPWKTAFNSRYAARLLRENAQSGDAIYAGNLILAQAAVDTNDIAGAKRYLLEAAATPGARMIDQNGLDVSVARVLFDRGERDTVAEYLHRGRNLWPKGTQVINRWEAAIRAGRKPNFNQRGGGPQADQQRLDN